MSKYNNVETIAKLHTYIKTNLVQVLLSDTVQGFTTL